MATHGPIQITAPVNDDARFQAWVQAVHDTLAAVGLVQTADTGQIDPATTTVPGSTGGVAGYEVWAFNDALQPTKPILIKVEYGINLTAGVPALAYTVGTHTDGAGTIGGQQTQRISPNSFSNLAAGDHPVLGSGDGSYVALLSMGDFANVNVGSGFLIIERTKDSNGVVTDDGFVVFTTVGNSPFFMAVPFLGTVPAAGSYFPGVDPSKAGIAQLGASIGMYPLMVFLGKPFYLWHGILGVPSFPGLTEFSAKHLGADHNFLALTKAVAPSTLAADGVGAALAIRWE